MATVHTILQALGSWWWVGAIILVLIFWRAFLWLFGVIVIGNNELGIVNLKFKLFGKNKALPDGKIIALNGEAGWQADTLAPGLHVGYFPWQYQVVRQPITVIPQGQLGVIEAKDGAQIPAGKVLAKAVNCDTFQSARMFLVNGGQRGPQMAIMPPGGYRVNKQLFEVKLVDAKQVPQNKVGVVTTFEGAPLKTGEIAGKEIPGHTMFQDGQAFVDNGGTKGLQVQVIQSGTYFLNPLLASVEFFDMTEVPMGSVGVVIAYVGDEHVAVAPAIPLDEATIRRERQIRVVPKGYKGVWDSALDPGKYPINPLTHKVTNVPTTNIVLNWADAKSEAHNLDANLSTIKVRSQDGFTYNMDVSQIIHIPRENAPKVISRFGTMINLVTQVLEPSIGNYFRNAAQASSVIDFLAKRAERQGDARTHIQTALAEYDVQAVDTLIGDIATPEALMKPLMDRKIAEQQQITYGIEKTAQDARQALAESTALADTKAEVVASLRRVEIEKNLADSVANNAIGEASKRKTIADADAHVFTVTGSAEATKILAVGEAQATVLDKKVNAVGKEGYVAMQVADYLATNHVKLVPDILVNAGGDGKSGSLVEGLLAMMVANQATSNKPAPTAEPPTPKAA